MFKLYNTSHLLDSFLNYSQFLFKSSLFKYFVDLVNGISLLDLKCIRFECGFERLVSEKKSGSTHNNCGQVCFPI